MDTSIKGLNKWANRHTSYPIDLMRVVLGVFFVMKGISFITNNRDFEDLIAPVSNFLGGMITFHYIAAAHIVGGIIIVFGLLTRWAILAQLPILVGAIVINFFGEMHGRNLLLATITLIVSVFFLFYGSGKHSADYYFKMEK
jgi:putative oxidoreductase